MPPDSGQRRFGELHSFGVDPKAALDQYLNQRDDLQVGRTPRRSR
jgi:hypothetical protein